MQSGQRSQVIWQKEHLWLALQGLGFEPSSEAGITGKILDHITFGVNMFDKPNKNAFYVVFHFLFAKLDNAKSKEVFRYCWPPLDKKKDAEFRKACCEWLRKISDDAGNGFPQVVASIFLSPGGPKFVHLLYHFARYVMLQHIRKDVEGANSFIPDALQLRMRDSQKALARNKLARHRYLKVLQRENIVIKEYQQKAWLLVKQIRDLRSECSALQSQLKIVENVDRDASKRDDGIQKIRCMWITIMQELKDLEEEVEVVDAVVKGNVDQYCLDGTNVALNIPNLLVSRLESEMHKLQMENVYEAGKVNLITVVQLLNEALKMLRQERCQQDCHEVRLDLQYLTGKAKFETDVFTRLRQMRHKIKREDLVAIEKSIADREREWEKKWEKLLGISPFRLFKGLNPVLELHSPMAPFSFDPATEEVLKSSVFCQYPASLPELGNNDVSLKDVNRDRREDLLRRLMGTTLTPPERNSVNSVFKTTPVRRRMSLNEKELRTPTPNVNDRSFKERTPHSSLQKRRSEMSWKTNADSMFLLTPTPNKQNPRSMECQQLAQQVADYIVSESPRSMGGRGMELDDLIGMLSSDPFLSRKEIPRTPENLISDIRTSWRKAIQSEDSSDGMASPMVATCMDSPAELESAHCSQIDLSMACFLSTSHVSDHNESSETRIPGNAISLSHLPATLCHNTVTDLKSEANTSGQEGVSVPMKENPNPEMLISPLVDKNKTFVLGNLSDSKLMDFSVLGSVPGAETASAHTTLSWDSTNMEYDKTSDSREVIQFSILHETLPENMGNVSLSSTVSMETDENMDKSKLADVDCLKDKSECEWKAMEQKMDIHSIRSRYEAIKRTFLKSLTEDEHNDEKHTPDMQFIKHKSESSLTQNSGSMYSPLEKGLTLDLEYLMTPSPKDRKLSLPQLISFSPAVDDVHAANQEDLLDVFESQGHGNLNKTFDFVSDQQKSSKG
ncbi:HAUS augmin-like complex subunit 6 [Rhinophrynus dorsalis]